MLVSWFHSNIIFISGSPSGKGTKRNKPEKSPNSQIVSQKLSTKSAISGQCITAGDRRAAKAAAKGKILWWSNFETKLRRQHLRLNLSKCSSLCYFFNWQKTRILRPPPEECTRSRKVRILKHLFNWSLINFIEWLVWWVILTFEMIFFSSTPSGAQQHPKLWACTTRFDPAGACTSTAALWKWLCIVDYSQSCRYPSSGARVPKLWLIRHRSG